MTIAVSYSTPANGTAAIYSLITLLTANGWTISAWSDATTLVTGVALTANPYGSSASGAGNLGNTSAWFRLTSPAVGGYTREWLFQRGAADQTWTVSRSRLGFTTGGSATVIPTDATSGTALFTAGQVFDASLASRLLISVDTVTGAWVLFTVVAGGGNVRTVLFDEALMAGTYPTTPVADADPYLFGGYYNSTGLTATAWIVSGVSDIVAYKRFRHGLASASNVRVQYYALWSGTGGGNFQAVPSGNGIGLEPYNNSEVPVPIMVGVAGAASASTGWVGIPNRQRWVSAASRLNGQTLTDGSLYWIDCGGIWQAWDATTPSI